MSAPAVPGYRLRRLVHRGTSFDVYDAWSDERACPVVVKRTRPGAAAEAGRRLLREGRMLLTLTHPHIVRAYEVPQVDRPTVVLETLTGQTLDHLFDENGALAVRDVAELGRQLASALVYLHSRGIVHGDLKPANAVNAQGLARLIDLSLAGPPRVWRSARGTPGYVSPEQARREQVSPATDVWGLGLLLLEAAADDDPYPVGDDGRYREGHGPLEAPVPLSRRRRVPARLGDLVTAMSAFDPAARPSMAHVRRELEALAER
ncbi:hypothetical protein GCM10009809_29880 [Isoptericola hypogeus]|uniref:Protein kinase domain-containing protein n=1 Tax=Isoptericola hypogeus TaxID=300179 RepID=A0ABN2JPQ7_9MICO